jgi:hypothetical protein
VRRIERLDSQDRVERYIKEAFRFPETGGKFFGGEVLILRFHAIKISRVGEYPHRLYTSVENRVEHVFAFRVSVIVVAMLARTILQPYQHLPLKEAGPASHNLNEIALTKKFRDEGLQVRKAVMLEADAFAPIDERPAPVQGHFDIGPFEAVRSECNGFGGVGHPADSCLGMQ